MGLYVTRGRSVEVLEELGEVVNVWGGGMDLGREGVDEAVGQADELNREIFEIDRGSRKLGTLLADAALERVEFWFLELVLGLGRASGIASRSSAILDRARSLRAIRAGVALRPGCLRERSRRSQGARPAGAALGSRVGSHKTTAQAGEHGELAAGTMGLQSLVKGKGRRQSSSSLEKDAHTGARGWIPSVHMQHSLSNAG